MNIHRIDEFLTLLENANGDDHLRQLFATYSASFDFDVPTDPFSKKYEEKQFALYEKLAGKGYSTSNEESKFNVEECAINPFPYCHNSSALVGDQLMAIGFIIKILSLPKGSRILEFGPGWGNTTLALAKMGYKVTAVDIERNFVNLIEKRALMEKIELELVCDDFSFIKTVKDKYDAILFFECFHHSADHLGLIQCFDKALKPGGVVCFAAEPITQDFPIPWGLRMDGQSLWAIRKNGWLELGFNTSYFHEALARSGWVGFDHRGHDGLMSNAILAKRFDAWERIYTFKADQLQNHIGTLIAEAIQISVQDEGFIAFGPYIDLPIGNWKATLLVDLKVIASGSLIFDIVCDGGKTQLVEAVRIILRDKVTREYPITFMINKQVTNLELRVRCERGTSVKLTGIRLEPIHASI
jgi:2-polyprenyl-3-methyl-5-hydroxy-6-metoxy-1,4-benzoquinol methylase